MKKEMEKEDMLEDTYGSKKIRRSLDKKMKEHWATTEDQRSGLFWANLVFIQMPNPLDLVASLETIDKVIHCFSYS